MRFLHTSDWHLGQTLHDFDRFHEHQCFLDWLLATLRDEQVDVLFIIGDVFDNANPSASAQKQFYQFLQQAKCQQPDLQVVIVAGNHDSAARLEAPAPLLADRSIHIIGQITRLASGEIDLARLLIALNGADGRIAAWCLALPFLRPGDVPRSTDAAVDPFLQGVAELHRQLLAHALDRRTPDQALIATGHCHMVGGEISGESERNIVIGGSEALPVGIFADDIAYVALGHLHLAQRVAKREHVRYCGSPLPLSFSEIHYPHQVLLGELAANRLTSVRSLAVPRAVALLRIPERPAPMDQVLRALQALPDTPNAAQATHTWPYLQVRVLLDAPEPALRARIEAALEGKAVRLARIETHSATREHDAGFAMSLDDLQKLEPDAIFQRLYQQSFGVDAPAPLLSAFAELQQAIQQSH